MSKLIKIINELSIELLNIVKSLFVLPIFALIASITFGLYLVLFSYIFIIAVLIIAVIIHIVTLRIFPYQIPLSLFQLLWTMSQPYVLLSFLTGLSLSATPFFIVYVLWDNDIDFSDKIVLFGINFSINLSKSLTNVSKIFVICFSLSLYITLFLKFNQYSNTNCNEYIEFFCAGVYLSKYLLPFLIIPILYTIFTKFTKNSNHNKHRK